MIKPYNYTTTIFFNDKKIYALTSTRLLTEAEVQKIKDAPTAVLAADAYKPNPDFWRKTRNWVYSFKYVPSVELSLKKAYTAIHNEYGIGSMELLFDSRKTPTVSIIMERTIEPAKEYSFKDVFEYKDINRAAEYLKQFNLPINFSIDK